MGLIPASCYVKALFRFKAHILALSYVVYEYAFLVRVGQRNTASFSSIQFRIYVSKCAKSKSNPIHVSVCVCV